MESEIKSQLVRQSSQVIRPHQRFFDVTRLLINVRRAFRRSPSAIEPDEKAGLPPLLRTDSVLRRDQATTASNREFKDISETNVETVLQEFGVLDYKQGLSPKDARQRLLDNGPNELDKEPPRPFWKLLLDQFTDLLVLMLIAASIISMALGQYPAATVIIIIILANAILGVVQEMRAGEALDALSTLSAPIAIVRRDGKNVEVPSSEVVIGDILILPTGKKVAADCRLITSEDMTANEMALTGESEDARKDAKWGGYGLGSVEQAIERKESSEGSLTEKNMVFMGCAVSNGHGVGVVVKTGMKTKMGEIATLVNASSGGESPLQAKLHDLGVKLGIASLAISLLVFVIGVSTERGADPADENPVWLQMLLATVSLTVAAVPEGLPACVTITLAIGMQEMSRKGALIRNLHSVETLGSASVICTDKTGTLTKGAMTAVRLWFHGDVYRITGTGYDPVGDLVPLRSAESTKKSKKKKKSKSSRPDENAHHLPLLVAAMCCEERTVIIKNEEGKWEAQGNTTERPLVVAAKKIGIEKKDVDSTYLTVKENPFKSSRKMMSCLIDSQKAEDKPQLLGNSRYLSAVKGAPNYILKKCTRFVADDSTVRDLTEEDVKSVFAAIDDFSGQAFRVLAIAYQPLGDERPDDSPDNLEKDLVLAGLVASIDPERTEVTPSIEKARNAGIRTVMITGDYVKTAKAIAENIALLPRGSPDDKAVDCAIINKYGKQLSKLQEQIEKANPSEVGRLTSELHAVEDELDAITAYADVYARAKPADKITIVTSLQRQGHICSMTGDGVNDAPALKKANIGVAMGITGTDVAKGVADMILTDDNFCNIVEAIEQGRTIYGNISKFCYFLLSTNISEVFVMLFATAFLGLKLPLLPIQILWLNLATDGAPAIALAVESIEPGVMDEGPRSPKEPLIEKVMITGIVIQTAVLTPLVLGTYIVGLQWNTGSWDGINGDKTQDEIEAGTEAARTMTILVITFAELLRAYTSRSLRVSIFKMGVFSNRWMQYAVGTSVVCTLFIANTPGLQDVFGMRYISFGEWMWVLFMSFVPVTVDELTKYVYRRTGFGFRPKAIQPIRGATGQVQRTGSLSKSYASLGELEMKDSI